MKKLTTNDEIENLCEAMITDFMKKKNYRNARCVDIEAFVTEYLGIPIVYESFAEPDPGRIGFFSDGERSLWISRDGRKQQVVFPKNTAVIEKVLLRPEESARRRFTIAHEGAHLVINRHIPGQRQAAFHSEIAPEVRYTPELLKEALNITETFTNRAAAVFLMPKFLVTRAMKKYTSKKSIVIYDGNILAQEEKMIIQRIADDLGVSFSACFNRLKELDLFSFCPVDDYIRNVLAVGGDLQ